MDEPKPDWRLQLVTTSTEASPTGDVAEATVTTSFAVMVQYPGCVRAFPVPNATAMFLNTSARAWAESQRIVKLRPSAEITSVFGEHDADAINCLEAVCVSIIFAYSSLEAFSNEVIPEDFEFKRDRGGKCTEVFNKKQIERELSLDLKFSEILPSITGAETPKGTKIWAEFVELERVRDRLIHLKASDRIGTKREQDTIWKALLFQKKPPHAVAKSMIAHFIPEIKHPPAWFERCPF